MLDLNNPHLTNLIHRCARSVSSSFPDYVTADDTEQDIWLWVLKNKNTVSKVIRDNESWQAMLYSTMAKVAHQSAFKEEAASNGYSTDDVFDYSTKVVQTLLESVFDHEDWQPAPNMGDGMPKSQSLVNEGGDRVAMLSDVSKAVDGLKDDQYNLIIWHYKLHWTVNQLAGELDVTQDAARKRLERAVEAVRRGLGRKSPADMRQGFTGRSGRASVGNGQANYINERNYEG